jgi:hypothetical protein
MLKLRGCSATTEHDRLRVKAAGIRWVIIDLIDVKGPYEML